MIPQWQITHEDVERIRTFVDSRSKDTFVLNRISKNVTKPKSVPTSDHFWRAMVACLLTTQQKAGPTSPISRFISTEPFPLAYSVCVSHQEDVEAFVSSVLKEFGGIRRFDRIAGEIAENLKCVYGDNWQSLSTLLSSLVPSDGIQSERRVARYLDEYLSGFGPKQSRNLLQLLGLTMYEIPLDSRVMKWFNEKMWAPLELGPQSLADPGIYEFILDGIQELCRQAEVYPCVLDAAIFSSYDKGGWSKDQIIW